MRGDIKEKGTQSSLEAGSGKKRRPSRILPRAPSAAEVGRGKYAYTARARTRYDEERPHANTPRERNSKQHRAYGHAGRYSAGG